MLTNPQDVVMEYSFGHSEHLLETENFGLESHNVFMQWVESAALLRHMYWIFQLIQSLPEWLAVLMSPGLGLVIQLRQVWASKHLSFPFQEKIKL